MRVLVMAALAAASTACATSGATPRPFPTPAGPPAISVAPPASSIAAPALVQTALALRGTRYRSGGSDPNGFDCSGFVWYVFAQHGVAMPRTVAEQYAAGEKVDVDDVRPGDLVFFRTAGRGASHVGIALDAGAFVHAPSSRGVVRVEPIGSSYWGPRFVGARRIQP